MIADQIVKKLVDLGIVFSFNPQAAVKAAKENANISNTELLQSGVVIDREALLNNNHFALSVGGPPKQIGPNQRGLLGVSIINGILEISSFGTPFSDYIVMFKIGLEYINDLNLVGMWLVLKTTYGGVSFELPSTRAYEE